MNYKIFSKGNVFIIYFTFYVAKQLGGAYLSRGLVGTRFQHLQQFQRLSVKSYFCKVYITYVIEDICKNIKLILYIMYALCYKQFKLL